MIDDQSQRHGYCATKLDFVAPFPYPIAPCLESTHLQANNIPSFRTLNGVYEPSGIQQLPDGRFIVVEDDSSQPLSVLEIAANGSVSTTPLATGEGQPASGLLALLRHALGALGKNAKLDQLGELDDLEGVAVDRLGQVYASTSHSRDKDGKTYPAREKLIRFRIDGERVADAAVVTGLKHALTEAHPLLAKAAEIRDVKNDGGLNIEGLTMSHDQRALLVGFRSPLRDGQAIIATIANPEALFASGAEPKVDAPLLTLDLGGNGIRGMAYIPRLEGYLLIAGPVARAQVQFELWFWSGDADHPPRRVTVPGLPGFEHAEGVSAAVIDGQARIVIVSDDGSRQQERFARFLLLDPAELRIAP